jgi:hypothetical protein
MDDSEREKIKGQIQRLLKDRELYLTYGDTADVNRLTDEIANLEKKLSQKGDDHV